MQPDTHRIYGGKQMMKRKKYSIILQKNQEKFIRNYTQIITILQPTGELLTLLWLSSIMTMTIIIITRSTTTTTLIIIILLILTITVTVILVKIVMLTSITITMNQMLLPQLSLRPLLLRLLQQFLRL